MWCDTCQIRNGENDIIVDLRNDGRDSDGLDILWLQTVFPQSLLQFIAEETEGLFLPCVMSVTSFVSTATPV